MGRGAWRATVHGVAQSRTRLSKGRGRKERRERQRRNKELGAALLTLCALTLAWAAAGLEGRVLAAAGGRGRRWGPPSPGAGLPPAPAHTSVLEGQAHAGADSCFQRPKPSSVLNRPGARSQATMSRVQGDRSWLLGV